MNTSYHLVPLESATSSDQPTMAIPTRLTTCVILTSPSKTVISNNAMPNYSEKLSRLQPALGQPSTNLNPRFKKQIDFAKIGSKFPKSRTVAVDRRNERERNRVKQVNMGFARLRDHVPSGEKKKKMSKVDTLRSAVEYIKHLQAILAESDSAESQNSNGALQYTSMLSKIGQGYAPASPPDSLPSTSDYHTDSSGLSEVSLGLEEEDEYLQFTNWFH